ncbi:MAG: SGNH/GDSL hydrolase family protein [Opitutus sp.]|nr:SGNH/GDSL hydrolase family protein [Opitutus sp.]MCS6248483.1 SGNH/GDSL hydrolase family protein [Opitutus sp.]MCS6275262.1 SGNH/GDSL hydrolase family protein [Opitutus sp.]MCS6276705.1 SGNH/GDSL hydrolase family protein [Opitutus sp.]MCS6301645.1 SGNH/GDSL hydrolase family protein [Opitutus sp.]
MKKSLAKLQAQSPVTIVSVGDSNNVIAGHTKGHFNWFHHLHLAICETYGDGCVYTINSAVCGNTVAKQLLRLEQDILRWKPDLVIASFGINDQNMGVSRIEEFRTSYRAFVERVRRESGAEILMRTPAPKVFGSGYGEALPSGAKPGVAWPGESGVIERYARAIAELGRELDCVVCDHYSAWAGHKSTAVKLSHSYQGLSCRYADTLHLNAQGHLTMFRELAPCFHVPARFNYEE